MTNLLNDEALKRIAKQAQGLDPDNEALPYKPEFDLATKRINEEILNLQNLMKSQFKKHPNGSDQDVLQIMREAWNRWSALQASLFDLDSVLMSLE